MELKYSIAAPVSEVYPFFADLVKFGDAHPIIFHVEDLGNDEYRMHEELNMLVYKHKFNYKASIIGRESNKKVAIYSNVQKGVHLNLTFSFNEVNGQTHINEIISVKAIAPVKWIFHPILKKSHLQLVNEIRRRLNK